MAPATSQRAAVFAAVGDLLEDSLQIRLMEVYGTELREKTGRTGEIRDGDRDEALDQLVDQRYTGLVASWEGTIAEVL